MISSGSDSNDGMLQLFKHQNATTWTDGGELFGLDARQESMNSLHALGILVCLTGVGRCQTSLPNDQHTKTQHEAYFMFSFSLDRNSAAKRKSAKKHDNAVSLVSIWR
jgi:hypothetical protein